MWLPQTWPLRVWYRSPMRSEFRGRVAACLAEERLLQVADAIGIPEPVSIHVKPSGAGRVADAEIARAITTVFDMTPAGSIRRLELKKPGYKRTAAYGHFGRNGFTWEKLDYVDRLSDSIR